MLSASVRRIVFMAALVIPFAGAAWASETISIGGDPCTVPLAKRLGEAFSKKTGVTVNVEAGGCRSGLQKVDEGKVDIGVSTFNHDPGKLPKGVHNLVIGKAPIIMVVNKSNSVSNLTREQLEGVMSGTIRNWKEVGGKDMGIKNVLLPPCVTETMGFQLVSYGRDITRLTPEVKGNPVTGTNALVEKDEAAIGMQLYGYQSGDVKVLTIDGVLPDETTMPDNYGFYEEYNMSTKGEPNGRVKEFIEFARSEEGRRIMVEMQHVPN